MTTITRAQMIERYQLTENYIKKHGAKLGEIPGTRPRIYVQEIAERMLEEIARFSSQTHGYVTDAKRMDDYLPSVFNTPGNVVKISTISGRGGRRK